MEKVPFTKRKDANAVAGVLLLALIGWGWWNCGGSKPDAAPKSSATASTAPTAPSADSAEGKRAQIASEPPEQTKARTDFIHKLERLGVFHKVEYTQSAAHVQIGQAWAGVPFDDKQNFVAAVLAQCIKLNPECDLVSLRDWRTNKKVGSLMQRTGLDLDGD
jgi:hypothetical protein